MELPILINTTRVVVDPENYNDIPFTFSTSTDENYS